MIIIIISRSKFSTHCISILWLLIIISKKNPHLCTIKIPCLFFFHNMHVAGVLSIYVIVTFSSFKSFFLVVFVEQQRVQKFVVEIVVGLFGLSRLSSSFLRLFRCGIENVQDVAQRAAEIASTIVWKLQQKVLLRTLNGATLLLKSQAYGQNFSMKCLLRSASNVS